MEDFSGNNSSSPMTGSVKNMEFGMGGILLGLFFVAVVFLALNYFNIISLPFLPKTSNNISEKVNPTVKISSQQNIQPYRVGEFIAGNNNESFQLIAKISRVYSIDKTVYIDINYPNRQNKTITKKIDVFDGNDPSLGTTALFETMDDLSPTSNYNNELLKSQTAVLEKINSHLNQTIMLIFLIDPTGPKKYVDCNKDLLESLNKGEDPSLCTALSYNIYVKN